MGIEGIQQRIDPIREVQPVGDSRAQQQKTTVVPKNENVKMAGTVTASAFVQKEESVKEKEGLSKPAEKYNQPLLEAMAERTDKKLQSMGTSAKFSYNKDINRIVITIAERDSGKVLKEIPPEDTQRVLEKIHMMTGMVMDEEI